MWKSVNAVACGKKCLRPCPTPHAGNVFEVGRDVCMHECNPIEGSPRTHLSESGGNGWTVLDDKRDQRQVEATRIGPSKRWHSHRSI